MKRSVLMLQNNMNPPGGSNTVSLWMLDAIKTEYDVTVLTWDPIDYESVNAFYGTALAPSDFEVVLMPTWIRALTRCISDPWEWQRYSFLMRRCKQIQHRYDLLLAAHDETDFGRPGVQYVHYPFQAPNWELERAWRGARGVKERLAGLVSIRLRPWRLISGFSFDRMKRNHTLVNSDWTGEQFTSAYGPSRVETVYPPVLGGFEDIPWDQKENGFVCIGRFAADKRVDHLIEILARVRERHPDLRLHLVGQFSPWEDEGATYRRVRDAVDRHRGWICLHENISRRELTALVSRQRYGIHGKVDEHFGLAVAEMVTAGCLPFVPNGGGQVEIVNRLDDLIYNSDEEAVEKIQAVLSDTHRQASLVRALARQKDRFSLATFRDAIRRALATFVARSDP